MSSARKQSGVKEAVVPSVNEALLHLADAEKTLVGAMKLPSASLPYSPEEIQETLFIGVANYLRCWVLVQQARTQEDQRRAEEQRKADEAARLRAEEEARTYKLRAELSRAADIQRAEEAREREEAARLRAEAQADSIVKATWMMAVFTVVIAVATAAQVYMQSK